MSVEYSAALEKLKHYCAYQERCHQEVRAKLLELKVYGDELEAIIAELISENFLNEERFAKIYAGSKFRQKQWGRYRIKRELKSRQISAYCIRKGLAEIEEDEYLKTIETVLRKKYMQYRREKNDYERRQKAAKAVISRGFESNLVWETLKTLNFEHDDD